MAKCSETQTRDGPERQSPFWAASRHGFRLLALTAPPGEHLIRRDADKNHRAHNGEVERGVNPEQVDKVLQDLKQSGSDKDTDHGPLTVPETTPTENRS